MAQSMGSTYREQLLYPGELPTFVVDSVWSRNNLLCCAHEEFEHNIIAHNLWLVSGNLDSD